MANLELAAMVLKQITTHPETHYQAAWVRRPDEGAQRYIQLRYGAVCDTQMCVAGWAVHFNDVSAEPMYGFLTGNHDYHAALADSAWLAMTPDGTAVWYSVAGREALGITETEAEWLFDSGRSKDEVVDALTELVETGRIVEPWEGYED